MYLVHTIILLSTTYSAFGQIGKCDQTPPEAVVATPSDNKDLYHLEIENAAPRDGKISYTPDQTYVLKIITTNSTRPFRWFMITAEDPEVDNNIHDFGHKSMDVGILKTLDTDRKSRYSERCASSVEHADHSDKMDIEIHWVSPKQTENAQTIRIRAMVAENKEVWYTGDNLTLLLEKDNQKPRDYPPHPAKETCNLCSEARYEVIFNGLWSRVAHPRHYPSKPDENGYSHMIGASHAYNFTLWQQGSSASPGLKLLAEEANVSLIEREIINNMSLTSGTRTLIRGKRRHHPYMFEPSYSLFRVDRVHHLFSIAIGMRPSPDWFLGTTMFELCTDQGWLEEHELPLYPWDAGTMDGVSYESPKSMTQPVDNIKRVEVGSFERNSPFYQINLNDLKPFANLIVRRLDVYPLNGVDCSVDGEGSEDAGNPEESKTGEDEAADEPDGPVLAESRQKLSQDCDVSEWGEWTPCVPSDGICGGGIQTRTRLRTWGNERNDYYGSYPELQVKPLGAGGGSCYGDQQVNLIQSQNCFVDCY